MNSGTTSTVTHPELVSCTQDGRLMYLNDADGTHMIEMLLVEELKAIEPEWSATKQNGE